MSYTRAIFLPVRLSVCLSQPACTVHRHVAINDVLSTIYWPQRYCYVSVCRPVLHEYWRTYQMSQYIISSLTHLTHTHTHTHARARTHTIQCRLRCDRQCRKVKTMAGNYIGPDPPTGRPDPSATLWKTVSGLHYIVARVLAADGLAFHRSALSIKYFIRSVCISLRETGT